ncbi:MAG: WD40/YVTN/BNR-like repeat-containing protein, partial [Planctomycetota bacterium]
FAAVLLPVGPAGAAGSAPWKVVKSPAEGNLRAVFFADDENVFAVGDEGMVLQSKDKGVTWSRVKVPSKAVLRGIHFTDPKHGWICGDGDMDAPPPRGHILSSRPMISGTCLITANGGKTWKRTWVGTNFELRSIWMASHRVGQICNHGGETHIDGDKIITKDGGKTWRGKRTFRGMNDCFWFSEKEGWAVGSPVCMGFVGGPPTLPPLLANKTARILHTLDGGETWKPVDAEDFGPRKQLRSLWFVKKKFGCAVGDDGVIFITTDGGGTWERCESATKKMLLGVCFTDEKTGWAVGEGGVIVKTTDGGKKWKVEKSPVEKKLNGLHFHEKEKVGIAVGEGGTLLRLAP